MPKLTRKALMLLTFFVPSISMFSQINENFSDGDFINNPTWTVNNNNDWIVSNQTLQSNNTTANSVFYISTANTMATQTQWEFYSKLVFNTSSANYVDVYITASQSDLTLNNNAGYFVRLGSTDDDICFYRKDANGTMTKLIDGTNGILNTSNNTLKIKITRTAANVWTLYRDISGTGNNYIAEGNITDATFNTSAFFGMVVHQSTNSFFQRHFFDDIEVKTYVPDITPPSVQSVTATDIKTLDVLFSESVDLTTSQTITNYTADNNIGSPITAVRDANNSALVHLTFSNNFPVNTTCHLTVNGVSDLSANVLNNGVVSFFYYQPNPYDLVIDEIMSDPSPQVELPNSEWIEIRNTTTLPINLTGWKIGDISGTSGPMPNFILQPDSCVVVCTSSAVAGLSVFGNTISVTSFPSLDNTGEMLFIKSPDGRIIHAVEYNVSWFQNAVKSQGGWTLEMIDTKNPCNGSNNWAASADVKGGTPGKINSVNGTNRDETSPRLLRAFATDQLSCTLVFDEPLDSIKASNINNYIISDGIGKPISATAIGPLFNKISLKVAAAFEVNKVYTVTASTVTDCAGNAVGASNTCKLGLASMPDSFDVIINEILFNPKPGGVDYVELYNRSNKIVDLKNMIIANRNTNKDISSLQNLSLDNYLLFPGEYIVATENAEAVKNQYIAKNPDAFTEVPIPSYSDDNGNVVVLNQLGKIVDELPYSYKWHFALIDNDEGISLEKIDYNKATNDPNNWTSAASTVGYGTPTYQNSQYRMDLQAQGEIAIVPELFSPDNDGLDDYAMINFKFPEPGYVANITIYDGAGRPIRILQKNATCGTTGSFKWDGLNDKSEKAPIGIYIIYTEIFNLQGKKKAFKNTVVVARKF